MATYLDDLLAYHHETNQLFIEALRASSSPPEGSIRLMSHIINAHVIWLDRIEQKPFGLGVWDLHTWEKMRHLNEDCFSRTQRILTRNKLTDRCFYHNSKQVAFENTIGEILFHVINHSTHHRGQLAMLIRQGGQAPPVSDYIFARRSKLSE